MPSSGSRSTSSVGSVQLCITDETLQLGSLLLPESPVHGLVLPSLRKDGYKKFYERVGVSSWCREERH
jgi:hypothetical protein